MFKHARIVSRRALALCAAALLSCVVNPVTGNREFSVMSPAQEAQVGREESAKVEQQIGLVKSPQLVGYIERLGKRLAVHSPRKDTPYRFYVADMEEPNAFALPGGRYRLIYDCPVPAPESTGPDAIREFTQRCTDVLEMYVRRDPHLWLWMHRRWRDLEPEAVTVPGMFPAAASDESEPAEP